MSYFIMFVMVKNILKKNKIRVNGLFMIEWLIVIIMKFIPFV